MISIEMATQGVAGVVEGVLKHLDFVEKEHRRAVRAAWQEPEGNARQATGTGRGAPSKAHGKGTGAGKGARPKGSGKGARPAPKGKRSARTVDQVRSRELVRIVVRRAKTRLRRSLSRRA